MPLAPVGSLTTTRENTNMIPKNTICLWFDKDAQDAARFYAATFPDSAVTAVRKAPGDFPGGKQGDVLTVEFTVLGIPCLGLNGGPAFKQSEAFSFQAATDDQAETDRYWNAIVDNGGKESECGWCKDRWGLSWQITPRTLTEAMAAGGAEAKRAFDAMMTMQKIDVAKIDAARRG
jgi:predicted 3-demethylubiquinone-9 3-methyltransferase (glyoxalase superfamily)